MVEPMADDPNHAIVTALACELLEMTGPMEIVLQPQNAYALAGLMQLALRHPHVSGVPRSVAQAFLTGVRQYFAGRPTILRTLDQGDDPQCDVPPPNNWSSNVRCAECAKNVSGIDPELGLVVRAYVVCPECLAAMAD